MIKFRGSFATIEECDERAEYLIREVDSYHPIFHSYVGRPFPLTTNSDFSEDTKEIDLKKKITETISSDVKEKRLNEKREIDDIKSREQKLLAETGEDFVEEPLDLYITLRVKKAQLIWTYLEHTKKKEEIRDILVKTNKQIHEMNADEPSHADNFYAKYTAARKAAGFDDKASLEKSFMMYLNEDAELDFEY